MIEHDGVALMRRCETAVRAGSPHEELVYADSTKGMWRRPPFGPLAEAFEYEFNAVVRALGASWAPLGSPADALGFPTIPGSEPREETVSTAFFPKDGLLGYAALRRNPLDRLTIAVGALEPFDKRGGGAPGEGDEARVGLSVAKWVM